MDDKPKIQVTTIEYEGKQSLVFTFLDNGKEHEVVIQQSELPELLGKLIAVAKYTIPNIDPTGTLEGLRSIVRSGKSSIKHQQAAARAIGYIISCSSLLGVQSAILAIRKSFSNLESQMSKKLEEIKNMQQSRVHTKDSN